MCPLVPDATKHHASVMDVGLVVAIAIALAFALTNGFHDASNAIATLVATRGATPGQAVLLSATFNMLGAVLLGTAVADTIGKIVQVPDDQVVLVVGSANSSNSVRLVEVALEAGAGAAYRVDNAIEIDPAWFFSASTVGVTSGASVPDSLVSGVLDLLADAGFTDVVEVTSATESLVFALPPELRRDLKAAQRI